jgi:type I restriction enzyme S subunit
MTIWKEYKLSDFAEINPKIALKKGVEYSFVEMKDLSEGNKFVTPSQKKELKGGSRFENGDTLFARITPCLQNGKICEVKELENGKGFGSTEFLVFRGKEGVSDSKFVHYLSLSNEVRSFAEQNMVGTSGRQRVSWQAFENLVLSLPDLPTQTAIAEILSSLDDKIELNNKINQELENLAQTLFKQWFIDFEFHCLPENYKFSGAVKPTDFDAIMTYKRVGGLPLPDGQSWFVYVLLSDDESFYKGMTNDLYRRFYEHFTGIGADHTKMHQPVKVIHWEQFDSKEEAAIREKELKTGYGRTWLQRQWAKVNGGSPAPECQLRMAGEMIDSELGEIPKGWEVGTFGDLCKIVNGYAFKSKDFQEKGSNGILKIRNVNGNVVDIINTQFVSNGVVQSVQDKFKVLSGHILIAMTGAEVGKTGIVPETDKSLWLNQRVGRLEPIIDNSKVFIYHMFNVLNFTQAVRNSAMGSAQPNISASGIESLNCLIPAEEVALNFSSINLDSFNLTLKNMGENQELTNLRDTLLPKLISGELEVSEVKEG